MLQYVFLRYILPIAGAILLGLAVAFIARRNSLARMGRGTRTLAAIGSMIGFVIAIERVIFDFNALSIVDLFTFEQIMAFRESPLRFTPPLIAGCIATFLLLCAPRQHFGEMGASLTRRSTFAFTPRSLLVAILLAAAASVTFAIAAGRASTPDDQGRFLMYWVDAGPQQSGTFIYGWHFSIPALIALAILLALSALAIWCVSKPPLGPNPAADIAERRLVSTFIASSALAAVLVHLSTVSQSLANTARLGYATGSGKGAVVGGTPFAALAPTLQWLDVLFGIAGIAIWSYIFWRSVLGTSKTQS